MITKKLLLLTLLYALYHFLTHFFLGIHEFYESNLPLFGLILIQTGAVFITQFGLSLILIKFNKNNPVLKSASYLLSSISSSILLFFTFQIYSEYYLTYFIAFLITGMVYSLFDYFTQFLKSVTLSSSFVSINSPTEQESKIFSLTDTKGKTRLSINLSTIICFEANDNYVTIYIEDSVNNCIKKMERISMKRIEEFLGNDNSEFIRIHKSYIVNTNFIIQVIGKVQSQKVRLKYINDELPVSRKINISDYIH